MYCANAYQFNYTYNNQKKIKWKVKNRKYEEMKEHFFKIQRLRMQSNKQHNFVSQMILISLYLQQPQTKQNSKKKIKTCANKRKTKKNIKKSKSITFHKEWDLHDQ